jgi:molybdate transport system substrate-binding protein
MRTVAMLALLALVSLAGALSACAGNGGDHDTRTITVAAATSLTGAFTEIGDGFAADHPDVDVTFTFDSSSALGTQIIEGAPADVYASADDVTMARLSDEDLVAGTPEIFARNELVIVTAPGNPDGVETLADLAGAGVISLCGEDVPCGTYAAEALDRAGVTIDESSITRGQNATATLTAVSEGDADAGIVYATDAGAAGDAVEAVAIPEDLNPIATYPIAVLEASDRTDAAETFVAYVLSDEGQAVLAEHGFLPAP